jgi:hypothetical protein
MLPARAWITGSLDGKMTAHLSTRFRCQLLHSLLVLGFWVGSTGSWQAQAQCTGTATTAVTATRTAGSGTVTMGVGFNTSVLYVGMPLQGTGLAAGSVVTGIINATTFTISPNATAGGSGSINFTTLVANGNWQVPTVPAGPPTYTSNVPPTNQGILSGGIPGSYTGWHCDVCPSLFTVDLCGNEYARMWMCPGNLYTIALCGSAAAWNSTISITGNATAFLGADGFTTFDDDGCGSPNGHAQVTYTPLTPGLRSIRILSNQAGNPCIPNHLLCGTLTISCSPTPPPPVNDNPCGAVSLPVNATCTSPLTTSSNWATATSGVPPASCGTYGGYDVWYSAVVPPSGALGIQVNHIGALDMAMAIYRAPACTTAYTLAGTRTLLSNLVTGTNTTGMVVGMSVTGTGIPAGTTVASIVNGTSFTMSNNSTANVVNNMQLNAFTELACNADITAGFPEPFIAINDPGLAGQTLWVRLFPQGTPANGGSFEICAFEPVPPTNDNPCTATPVPVTPACTPVSATTEGALATGGVPVPTCGNVPPINDVWFTVQIPLAPPGVGVEIDLSSSVLNDPAMAVYRMNPDCNTLVQVTCNDPVGGGMPGITVNQNGTTIVAGTVLYVRVWNKTPIFGNFQICASPTTPPVNDDPCGALALPVNFGCLFSGYTNENASVTPTNPLGVINVPNPSCAVTANADVWFTVQVPNPFAAASLVIDSDDGSMTDGAFAIYRVASGTCAGNNLVLTQLNCVLNGSPTAATMPFASLPAASLVPGERLYIRMWRQSGSTGTFSMCAARTDPPPGNCNYTLRMQDSFGDGWNGSFVTVCIDPPGPAPNVCTNYTINNSIGNITFGANLNSVITVSYTAVGGFQNQISFLLLAANGGQIVSSALPAPIPGLQGALIVNNVCNAPPAPIEDCLGAIQVCQDFVSLSGNPQNTGSVVDLTTANRGCLVANERQGVWYSFQVSAPGQVGFTINAAPYGGADYDYGLWGPYTNLVCPPTGLPLRCSWGDGPVLTGLNWIATDFTEGAFGDSWTRYITANAGEWYILFIDNFYTQYWGTPFDLSFQFQPGCTPLPTPSPLPCASISCVLPVELMEFVAEPAGREVMVSWATGSEQNSDHFMVERSTDGEHFEAIGRVGAAGTSGMTLRYTWPDKHPVQGWNYYRLKQVDIDGTSAYSPVRSVFMSDRPSTIEVYPNPANDVVNIVLDELSGQRDLLWRVLDASGRVVIEGSQQLAFDANRMSIPVERLDAGSYVVAITTTQGTALGQGRFVKK